MTLTQKRTYCTDATWLGRSDCAHCNIRNVMIFSGLPESSFSDQLAPVDHFLFPAGSTLYKEGDDDGAVFSVRRGIIKLSSLSREGQPRIVRLVGPGMAIGLELLDQDERYRHTAVALNEADACRIPVSIIRTLELQHPEICQQIRRRLQLQLDRADQWIVELGTGSAKKRVAR
ncbi:MAG: Crp/Fnr family transcriptional regulator, partial [Thiohalobacterales bacterium]|nr:Crp/Fnr family transcriptional regulator [Thiohalobacterales bacterium]